MKLATDKLHSIIGDMVSMVGWALCGIGVVWAIYIVGIQVYHYLQTGDWLAVGLLTYVGGVFSIAWANYPLSWVGLHKILDAINAGVGIAIIGLVPGVALANYEKT